MSAENGIPVDKCPKCGMPAMADYGYGWHFYQCGTQRNPSIQTNSCKRIAELTDNLSTMTIDRDYWRSTAESLQAKIATWSDQCPKHG